MPLTAPPTRALTGSTNDEAKKKTHEDDEELMWQNKDQLTATFCEFARMLRPDGTSIRKTFDLAKSSGQGTDANLLFVMVVICVKL